MMCSRAEATVLLGCCPVAPITWWLNSQEGKAVFHPKGAFDRSTGDTA